MNKAGEARDGPPKEQATRGGGAPASIVPASSVALSSPPRPALVRAGQRVARAAVRGAASGRPEGGAVSAAWGLAERPAITAAAV